MERKEGGFGIAALAAMRDASAGLRRRRAEKWSGLARVWSGLRSFFPDGVARWLPSPRYAEHCGGRTPGTGGIDHGPWRRGGEEGFGRATLTTFLTVGIIVSWRRIRDWPGREGGRAAG